MNATLHPKSQHRLHSRRHTMHASGFSLIELLAVISIVAILAALALPIFKSTRASSDRTKCISNLRQLGVATSLYTAENNNTFPALNFWSRDISPYLNLTWKSTAPSTIGLPIADNQNPFFCPASIPYRDTIPSSFNFQLAYGINCDTAEGKSTLSIPNTSGRKLSSTVLYADNTKANIWKSLPERLPLKWHNNSVNIIFCDYHVESVSLKSASDARWLNLMDGYSK